MFGNAGRLARWTCALLLAVAASACAREPAEHDSRTSSAPPSSPGPNAEPDRHPLARSWFMEYLHAEIPVLREPAARDWDKVNAVREWAYRRTPRAAPQAFLDPAGKPPEVLFAEFANMEGGFACAGTAELLRDVYLELGYAAYTYDMGTRENDLSHMLTVVRIRHDGAELFVVQDAYFNFTIETVDGEPVGLRQLLAALESQDLSRVRVASGAPACKPVATRVEDAESNRAYHAAYYSVGPIEVREGMAQYCHDFSLATFEGLGGYTSWVERQTGHDDLLYLFLFPLGTSGGEGIRPFVSEALRIQERVAGTSSTRP